MMLMAMIKSKIARFSALVNFINGQGESTTGIGLQPQRSVVCNDCRVDV